MIITNYWFGKCEDHLQKYI